MTLILITLIFSIIVSRIIYNSLIRKYNLDNKNSILTNKKQVIKLFKSVKESGLNFKRRDNIIDFLRIIFNQKKIPNEYNKIKYFLYFIPVFICSIYIFIGSPFYGIKNTPELQISSKNIDELITTDFSKISLLDVEEQIQFYIKLAIISNETGNLKAEIFALEKLNTLDKKNEDLKISLAKKLTDQAFGIVTAKARILISEVLEENPYQIDALYLAGLTAFQNSRNDIAKKVWSTVFEINPETKYKNSINENLLKMK